MNGLGGKEASLGIVLLITLATTALAHDAATSNLIVPQVRSRSYQVVLSSRGTVVEERAWRPLEPGPVEVEGVTVSVDILEQAAITTMDIHLINRSGRAQEASLLVPVPEGAVVKSFAFEGKAKEPTAVLMPADEAKRLYNSIVARIRDPALLEFAGYAMIRTSVFPVPARGKQRVRLTYEHILPRDGERVDYELPRSELIANSDVPWEITVRIRSKAPISTVYSPSHKVDSERLSDKEFNIRLSVEARKTPGAFRVSYLLESGDVSASLLAYPDPEVDGGYFLMLVGLPAENPETPSSVKREVTLVIDRSGSMRGEKIEQAREAALQVLGGLDDGEYFNIIDYSNSVSVFASEPVRKDARTAADARAYIRKLRANGGTNLHDALIEAVRQKPSSAMATADKPVPGTLPLVLFLTDGLPTVGNTNELDNRNDTRNANVHRRRIFTFGVGHDVNSPLLSKLSEQSRAVSVAVLPGEDVEVRVSLLFKKLSGPVLTSPKLVVLGAAGGIDTRRVRELIPNALPDLFEGDQLVLLGQYRGEEPLNFRLSGSYRGKPRIFNFEFKLDKSTTRNDFVPRLWASRRIAMLIDEIRQAGAGEAGAGNKELVEEIVRLSTKFGILTEYTAFLAEEGTRLEDTSRLTAVTNDNLIRRAVNVRSGIGATNQQMNYAYQTAQSELNVRNEFYDSNMNRVQISNVQQVSDRAFFRRNGRWLDSRVVNEKTEEQIDQRVKFGTKRYFELVDELVREHRQGTLAMGEVLVRVNGRNVLVEAPGVN